MEGCHQEDMVDVPNVREGGSKAKVKEAFVDNLALYEDVKEIPPEILRGIHSYPPGVRSGSAKLDRNLRPLHGIQEIFNDLASNAKEAGIESFLDHIGSRKLKVVTMCSGTEAPVLALEMFVRCFRELLGRELQLHHLFSAEIVPFKQSFIQRNFTPDILFRDVNELVYDEATTAFGSRQRVPTDPDLLVAGFSCVDFSTLNVNRRTELGQTAAAGESSNTFFAIRAYVDRHRPPLVILENVAGAPWKHIVETYNQIGYTASTVKVDTKDYYLPQTRQRGYMFAIDSRKYPGLASVPSQFESMMKDFRRPASSSITDFLLSQEDPRLGSAIDDMSSSTAMERAKIDWTRYKYRHILFRQYHCLGNKRPLSKWQENGTCRMPDFYWHRWCRVQTERVWDTLDLNYLRGLVRGYDINYKTRVIDFSQGIDREVDTRAFGIAGCVTPRGLHFITSRGGPLLGIEALALQGIPIDRLLTDSDSQRDLYDLAGNAMSTTVVGAAILSALILGRDALVEGPPYSPDTATTHAAMTPPTIDDGQLMMTLPVNPEMNSLSAADVIEGAKLTARLCLCEGKTLVKRSGLLRCSKCSHTACKRCRQTPTHAYEEIAPNELRKRIPPTEFEKSVRAMLPMRLQINGLRSDFWDPLINAIPLLENTDIVSSSSTAFKEALDSALGEELRFCGVARGYSWTVTYEGSHSVLKLTCSPSSLRWSLYILPPDSEPSNSPLRQILRRPVAWMIPFGEDPLLGLWHIRSPISSRFDIVISGEGEQIESHESRVGLQNLAPQYTTVWSRLRIATDDDMASKLDRDINGVYELLQDCGAARGSLHKKLSSDNSNPVYLFLDPTDIAPAEFDSWVFASGHERIDTGQTRDSIAEIRPYWSTFRLKGNEPQVVTCWYRQSVACKDVLLKAYCPSMPATYQVPVLDNIASLLRMDCNDWYITMLKCSFPATGKELNLNRGIWTRSNLMESSDLLKQFAWILQRAVSVNHFKKWRSIDFQAAGFSTTCRICAPEKPRLLWALDRSNNVRPFEHPEDAALHERSLKIRPPAFMGYSQVRDDLTVDLRVCLNIPALLHQAVGKLMTVNDLSLHWRLCVDIAGFARPKLPVLSSKDNKDDAEHSQPPGFKNLRLRPDQLQSLSWMISKEADDTNAFEEEEVVEAVLPVINWRAEGRATTRRVIQGGILGDDVGYGKTAISLGLIDTQFEADKKAMPHSMEGAIPIKATLLVVPNHLVDQWEREISKFLSRKYSVLVIKSVTSFNKLTIRKLQTTDIVLLAYKAINGDSYYSKLELFSGAPQYPQRADGRIFEDWLSDAMVGVQQHVDMLRNKGSIELLETITRKQEALLRGEGLFKYNPSKRRRGKQFRDYVASLQQPATIPDSDEPESSRRSDDNAEDGETTGEAPRRQQKKNADPNHVFGLKDAKGDWKSMKCPLLHMFLFNRVLIDEFTYTKGRLHESVRSIPARKRWILSGTPPLNDFADVKTFAPLLGVHLGEDEDHYGRDNDRLKDARGWRTDVEKFQPVTTRRSAAWHERRHGVAQRFLDHFMRKNVADVAGIQWSEHICEVVLSNRERAVYLELFMQLMSENLRIRSEGRGGYEGPEARRMDDLISGSTTVEEALLKRCSLYSISKNTKDQRKKSKGRQPASTTESQDSQSLILDPKVLLEIRAKELKDLASEIVLKVKLGLYLTAKLREVKSKNFNEKEKSQESDSPEDIGNPVRRFDVLLNQIEKHQFGDQAATKQIHGLIDHVKRRFNKDVFEKSYFSSRRNDKKAVKPETETDIDGALRQCTDGLLRLVCETVTRTRAARLFQTVPCFQNPAPGVVFGCHICFSKNIGPKGLYLLGECGHSVCASCVEKCKASEECQYPFCDGTAQEHRVISWEDLAVDESLPVNPEWHTYCSSKNAQLVRLLQDTTKIPEDDQVLIFVQFTDVLNEVSVVLKKAGITHMLATSEEISNFQRGRRDVRPKVLLLPLGGVTASGLNLQNANHVIFYSPFLAQTQYDYESGMAQAIGRSRRYGQEKHVHVYHFMALKTIEVSIFETRRRQVVVRRDGRFKAVSKNEVRSTDRAGWKGFSLEGTNVENFEDGAMDDDY